jgi:hypothetical protein
MMSPNLTGKVSLAAVNHTTAHLGEQERAGCDANIYAGPNICEVRPNMLIRLFATLPLHELAHVEITRN